MAAEACTVAWKEVKVGGSKETEYTVVHCGMLVSSECELSC
jgi:hypothetical protein